MIEEDRLFCFGLNHKTAPLDIREKVYLTQDRIASELALLRTRFRLSEILILSTCNRFEIYAFCQNSSQVKDAFCYLQKANKDVLDYTYSLEHFEDVVFHLMRVASSLDSLVIGETQITGQLKEAIRLATLQKTLGGPLERLCQEALSVSKKIRTQTSIGQKTVSVSHAAIDLVKKLFDKDLSEAHFVLLGAGDIAEVAAKYAVSHQPKAFSIVNRSLKKAKSLLTQLQTPSGQAYSLEELSLLLSQADILITSTASEDTLITKDFLKKIMDLRSYKPIYICDIAMPRDVDPACGDIPHVHLFVIDDLKQIVEENQQERRLASEKAEDILQQGYQNICQWFDSWQMRPALSHLHRYLDRQISQEKRRTFEKKNSAQKEFFTLEHKEAMDRLLESLKKRICADAALAIQKKQEEEGFNPLLRALYELFPNHEDSP